VERSPLLFPQRVCRSEKVPRDPSWLHKQGHQGEEANVQVRPLKITLHSHTQAYLYMFRTTQLIVKLVRLSAPIEPQLILLCIEVVVSIFRFLVRLCMITFTATMSCFLIYRVSIKSWTSSFS
jgi:hypothetical protein